MDTGVELPGAERRIPALGYVANARTWLSPVFQTPVGFASVQAASRTYPSMTATHALDSPGIGIEVSRLSGISGSSMHVHTYDHLADQGRVVSVDDAYSHARLLRRVRAEGGAFSS